ncbi:MAG: lysozyme [Erythrobacter sp.]
MDEKETVRPEHTATRPQSPTQATSTKLKLLLDELNRPLDGGERDGQAPKDLLATIRRERQQGRDLRRARKAAQEALGVKPRRSARKRAAAMLSVGAVGLAALSGPATGQGALHGDHRIGAAGSRAANVRLPAALLEASDRLKEALSGEEGVRFTVYRDVAGYPTVGIGHLVKPGDDLRVGDVIDEKRALQLLESDLKEAERGVRKLVGDLPLAQHEFDALLDLLYNVGFGNVTEDRSPALNAAISSRDYGAMGDELDHTFAGGATARGLEYRSRRRAAIFRSGQYSDPRLT